MMECYHAKLQLDCTSIHGQYTTVEIPKIVELFYEKHVHMPQIYILVYWGEGAEVQVYTHMGSRNSHAGGVAGYANKNTCKRS